MIDVITRQQMHEIIIENENYVNNYSVSGHSP